jgi:UDP-glucose 4-epimerase
MKCLVTGGAGFIGSHVVDKLIGLGHEVTVIDNLFTGLKENVNPKAKFIKKSINSNLDEIFEKGKFDFVFHLAAQANLRKSFENPARDASINVGGSLNILDCCVRFKIKKVIFSSTAALYSQSIGRPYKETDEPTPISPYGLTKLTVEKYLQIMRDYHGLNYVALRYSNAYGPRQNPHGEAGVVCIFMDNVAQGKDLVIYGDGEQTRDFIYVADVAAANIKAMEDDVNGVFNVSSQTENSINKIAEILQKLSGNGFKVSHEEGRKGELRRSCLCNDKLKGTGWKLTKGFEQGLEETYKYFTTKQ